MFSKPAANCLFLLRVKTALLCCSDPKLYASSLPLAQRSLPGPRPLTVSPTYLDTNDVVRLLCGRGWHDNSGRRHLRVWIRSVDFCLEEDVFVGFEFQESKLFSHRQSNKKEQPILFLHLRMSCDVEDLSNMGTGGTGLKFWYPLVWPLAVSSWRCLLQANSRQKTISHTTSIIIFWTHRKARNYFGHGQLDRKWLSS